MAANSFVGVCSCVGELFSWSFRKCGLVPACPPLSPEYVCKRHFNSCVDGLSQAFVDVYAVEDAGHVHPVPPAHSFQGPVEAFGLLAYLQEEERSKSEQSHQQQCCSQDQVLHL